jgi:hypothetical protein
VLDVRDSRVQDATIGHYGSELQRLIQALLANKPNTDNVEEWRLLGCYAVWIL